MTEEEASLMRGGIVPDVTDEPTFIEEDNLKESVNWVTEGAVTDVKNQKKCGSCWAFGTTPSLEAAHWKATGELLNLSEQQIISCTSPPNWGCNGGFPHTVLKYL